jgi:SAM-dependent methyltransferase
MIAGFARMQHLENELVPDLLRSAGVDWLVELAPAASPSPGSHAPRHRMLLDDSGWVWPCRLPANLLPFADETLPAVLMRHLFWIESGSSLLSEAVRCLKPGGLLVSVSANPFYRGSWQELGRDALQLPAWPRFLMQHGRCDLQLEVPPRPGWRGMIPAVAPLLVLAGRKPPRGDRVQPVRFRRLVGAPARPLATSCRAA